MYSDMYKFKLNQSAVQPVFLFSTWSLFLSTTKVTSSFQGFKPVTSEVKAPFWLVLWLCFWASFGTMLMQSSLIGHCRGQVFGIDV